MTLTDRDRDLLLQTFLTEAAEHLRTLEEALVQLEARPDDAELLHGIFRVAHSLKGDALMVGFSRIADFAHGLEDLLERLRDGDVAVDGDLISLLLRAVDVLRALLAGAAAGQDTLPADYEATQTALAAVCSGPATDAAAPAEHASTTTGSVVTDGATLRVDVAKLDRMLNLTGEIAIARGRVAQMMASLPAGVGQEILEAHRDADRLQLELQEQVMKARMVPVGPFFRQYARTVRDVARAHGKSVQLVIEGDEVEMDTRVVERLRDPLTHMIRNSIDHGIESPEARLAAGKSAHGVIELNAYHKGGNVIVEVSDDGGGLKREKILAKARERGLVGPDEELSEDRIYQLIFAPGFSTADIVSDVSGRGVGMDVVKRNINELGGHVQIHSTSGKGSMVRIRLPLTLAILDGQLARVGSEVYVVPIVSIVETIQVRQEQVNSIASRAQVFRLRDDYLPIVRLYDLFGIEPEHTDLLEGLLMIVEADGKRVGLFVDELMSQQQVVIKSLETNFKQVTGLAGATMLGDGRVALILDIPGVITRFQSLEPRRDPAQEAA